MHEKYYMYYSSKTLLFTEIILLSADVKLVSQLVWIAQAHWIVNMAEVISEWEVNQTLGLRGYLSGNIKNYLNVFLISYFDYKEFLCQIRNDSRSVKSASDSAVCRVLIMHWTTRSSSSDSPLRCVGPQQIRYQHDKVWLLQKLKQHVTIKTISIATKIGKYTLFSIRSWTLPLSTENNKCHTTCTPYKEYWIFLVYC